MHYENLEKLAQDIPIIYKNDMPKGLKGCYKNGVIFIREGLSYKEKIEVLSEEIGHHYTSAGDITDYSNIISAQQELKARRFGIDMTITLDGLIEVWKLGLHNLYEVAEYFNVSEKFVLNAIEHFKMRYGLVTMHNGYRILFEPLHISEYHEVN